MYVCGCIFGCSREPFSSVNYVEKLGGCRGMGQSDTDRESVRVWIWALIIIQQSKVIYHAYVKHLSPKYNLLAYCNKIEYDCHASCLCFDKSRPHVGWISMNLCNFIEWRMLCQKVFGVTDYFLACAFAIILVTNECLSLSQARTQHTLIALYIYTHTDT